MDHFGTLFFYFCVSIQTWNHSSGKRSQLTSGLMGKTFSSISFFFLNTLKKKAFWCVYIYARPFAVQPGHFSLSFHIEWKRWCRWTQQHVSAFPYCVMQRRYPAGLAPQKIKKKKVFSTSRSTLIFWPVSKWPTIRPPISPNGKKKRDDPFFLCVYLLYSLI